MKFTQAFLNVACFTGALALPTTQELDSRADGQVAHFKFVGSDGAYPLNVTANGETILTESDTIIEYIEANDYNAREACTFDTSSEASFELQTDTETGEQRITINPPQAVSSVSCQGTCIATYGACYDTDGQPLGACCAGFCAATRCRPWNINTGN